VSRPGTQGLGLDWQAFKQLRNHCVRQIRKAKSGYYVTSLSHCNGNPAKFWITVKSLKGSTSSSLPQQINSDTGLIVGKNAIINAFNHNFISAGSLFAITSKLIHNDTGLDADREKLVE
jgi:hypothetical protein